MKKIAVAQLKVNDVLAATGHVVVVAPVPAWEAGKVRIVTMNISGRQVEKTWGKHTMVGIKD